MYKSTLKTQKEAKARRSQTTQQPTAESTISNNDIEIIKEIRVFKQAEGEDQEQRTSQMDQDQSSVSSESHIEPGAECLPEHGVDETSSKTEPEAQLDADMHAGHSGCHVAADEDSERRAEHVAHGINMDAEHVAHHAADEVQIEADPESQCDDMDAKLTGHVAAVDDDDTEEIEPGVLDSDTGPEQDAHVGDEHVPPPVGGRSSQHAQQEADQVVHTQAARVSDTKEHQEIESIDKMRYRGDTAVHFLVKHRGVSERTWLVAEYVFRVDRPKTLAYIRSLSKQRKITLLKRKPTWLRFLL